MAKISSVLILAATLMMMLMTSSAIRSNKLPTNTAQVLPYFGNVMRSDQSFSNGYLARFKMIGGTSLFINNDCDLVYYRFDGEHLMHSDTGKLGNKDCSLYLTRNGSLQIKTSDESEILWESKNSRFCEAPDEFASLVLDSQAIIYCPAVWSTGKVLDGNIQTIKSEAKNILLTNFVLKSGEKLEDNSRRYELRIEECNAVIRDRKVNGEIQWQSWSRVNGGQCRAELDKLGFLSIVDDMTNETVWRSSTSSNTIPGEFALVLQNNGFAVIYGPEAWNAESPDSGLVPFTPELAI